MSWKSSGTSVWWWKTGLGSSRIKQHSSLGTESLNPRVPDSVCSESGRIFFIGLEPDLEWGRKWLDFYVRFGITTAFLSNFKPLKCLDWQNLTISLILFAFEPRNLSSIYRGAHTASFCSMQLHAAWALSCCLHPGFCSISTSFLPFRPPFFGMKFEGLLVLVFGQNWRLWKNCVVFFPTRLTLHDSDLCVENCSFWK